MEKHKTTCAIITNGKNEILLIQRGREPYKGYWSLPSGKGASKKGLPPKEAVLEEVRWDLETDLLNSEQIFSIPVENDESTDEVIVFRGSIDETKIQLRPGFSDDCKWVSLPDRASTANLAFEHSEIIEKFLKNH